MEEEYNVLIVDLGSHYTKYGTWENITPKTIPSFLGVVNESCFKQKILKDRKFTYGNQYCFSDEIFSNKYLQNAINIGYKHNTLSNMHHFSTLFKFLYYRECNLVPEENPIILIENGLIPKSYREKFVSLLFEDFNVPAIRIETSSTCVQSFYGVDNKSLCTVVDIGGISQIFPVQGEYPNWGSCSISNNDQKYRSCAFSGEDINQLTYEYLKDEKVEINDIDKWKLADDLKRKFMYVANDYSYHSLCAKKNINDLFDAYKPLFHIFPVEIISQFDNYNFYNGIHRYKSQVFKLPDEKLLKVKNIQFDGPELLFDTKNDKKELAKRSLQAEFSKCILSSDEKERIPLCSDVILSGGCTCFPGFVERFTDELKKTLPKPLANKLNVRAKKNREYANYMGVYALSKLDSFQTKYATKNG